MTNTPLQPRSQQTLDNILQAATDLLEEKSFEEMTIQDIVGRAGCSVGAFYGRLKDKDALLHALDAHYVDGQLASIRAWLEAQAASPSPDLASLLQSLMAHIQQSLLQHLGLLRMLILRVRLYPDPRFRDQEARLNEILPTIAQVILQHRDEIAHPDPETAVMVGFLQAYMAMREFLAWTHLGATFPLDNAGMVREFTRSFHSYLRS